MPDTIPGWHSRGFLPHYDDGETAQLVTYRLADALPAEVLANLEEQALDDEQRREEIERLLDAGHGSCLLCEAEYAEIVIGGWQHFDGLRYHLHAWCVMPNHVHVLLRSMAGHALSAILHSQKSFSAKKILGLFPGSAALRPAIKSNAGGTPALPGERRVWQPDYYDRFIRNQHHFEVTVDYIHQNPVKARLVSPAENWPWSSARLWEHGRPARSE